MSDATNHQQFSQDETEKGLVKIAEASSHAWHLPGNLHSAVQLTSSTTCNHASAWIAPASIYIRGPGAIRKMTPQSAIVFSNKDSCALGHIRELQYALHQALASE